MTKRKQGKLLVSSSQGVHRLLTLTAAVTPHSRIWQNRVSLTRRHSGFSLVTRLETPKPHVAEHSDQSVVCGKQDVWGTITRDTGRDSHSVGEDNKEKYISESNILNH